MDVFFGNTKVVLIACKHVSSVWHIIQNMLGREGKKKLASIYKCTDSLSFFCLSVCVRFLRVWLGRF